MEFTWKLPLQNYLWFIPILAACHEVKTSRIVLYIDYVTTAGFTDIYPPLSQNRLRNGWQTLDLSVKCLTYFKYTGLHSGMYHEDTSQSVVHTRTCHQVQNVPLSEQNSIGDLFGFFTLILSVILSCLRFDRPGFLRNRHLAYPISWVWPFCLLPSGLRWYVYP